MKTEVQTELIETIFKIAKNGKFNIFKFYDFLAEMNEDAMEKFRISSGFGSETITKEDVSKALEAYNNYVHPNNKI